MQRKGRKKINSSNFWASGQALAGGSQQKPTVRSGQRNTKTNGPGMPTRILNTEKETESK